MEQYMVECKDRFVRFYEVVDLLGSHALYSSQIRIWSVEYWVELRNKIVQILDL